MTFEEDVKHSLNNIKNSISGLYKNQAAIESDLLDVKSKLDKIQEGYSEHDTIIQGSPSLGYEGLKKRIEYLEKRDKWLRNKWVLFTGGIGGITILYGLLRAMEFVYLTLKTLFSK